MPPQFRRFSLFVGIASVLSASGCDALQSLEEGGALVHVFSTHHATPEGGIFPFKGEDEKPRVFENDLGWTVTLLESYITISAVTLVGCNGAAHDFDMFWGPCPEDLSEEDLETLTVAGLKAAPGNYCGLEVLYGPYETPEVDEEAGETRHDTPDNSAVTGATIYLRGAAQLADGDPIPFELRTSDSLSVGLDLSEIEGPGVPMRVGHEENFPKELTVSKTYDRFFDGVDFEAFDPASLEAQLGEVLRAQTRVSSGTIVEMDPASP